MKKQFLIAILTALVACSAKPKMNDVILSDRVLNLEEFFAGETVAYGQFQDLFGNIQRRFKVQINGTWDGSSLTLVENFIYEDGDAEQRIWTLKKDQ